MEWVMDSGGWWDLDTGDGWAASYQKLDNLVNRVRHTRAVWAILWHDTGNEEFLDPDEYTEAEVRNHIELKYKLLRGEHG
jgi:hypothetical protein